MCVRAVPDRTCVAQCTPLHSAPWPRAAWQALGRHKEAEPLLQLASRIQERRLGHEHPHTLASLANLATVYEAMGCAHMPRSAFAVNVLEGTHMSVAKHRG